MIHSGLTKDGRSKKIWSSHDRLVEAAMKKARDKMKGKKRKTLGKVKSVR